MPKCHFNKVALQQLVNSPVNLLHIFRTPFLKNTYGWLFLMLETKNLKKPRRITVQDYLL